MKRVGEGEKMRNRGNLRKKRKKMRLKILSCCFVKKKKTPNSHCDNLFHKVRSRCH